MPTPRSRTATSRTPFSIAVKVGVAVFVAMTVGVGGYQAVASHTIGAFTLGVDPAPIAMHSGDPVAGSALSLCVQSVDEVSSSSFITVHATSWRHAMSTQSKHSPTGLASVCN